MTKTSCVATPRTAARRQSITSKALLGAFNTWAFKREQPERPELLEACAKHAIGNSLPLQFVLYWGKGPREDIGAPDWQCLHFLARMADRVSAVHAPGAEVDLIFTDTHARLNGHAEPAIETYFSAMADAAYQVGFNHRRLSDVVAAAGDLASCDTAPPPEDILQPLIATSAKWYRGAGSARDGAVAYYTQNMRERAAVERIYPRAVFVTFNSSQMRDLFPERMPVFYMYSLRKGFAVKPWFLGSDRQPFADVDDARAHMRGDGASAAS